MTTGGVIVVRGAEIVCSWRKAGKLPGAKYLHHSKDLMVFSLGKEKGALGDE